MHTNEPRELEGVELGYDPRDIDLKGIKRVVIYFFAFTLIFFGGGAIVFVWKGWGGRTNFDARKPAIAGPLVQGNITAKVDIMTMRQTETRLLNTYGTNPDGKQRIPVDRAIALLSERGLPAIVSDKPAQTTGNTMRPFSDGTTEPASAAPAPAAPTEGHTEGHGEPAHGPSVTP